MRGIALTAAVIAVCAVAAPAASAANYTEEKSGNVGIPDGKKSSFMKVQISAPQAEDITNIQLDMRIAHPRTQDLVVTLDPPEGPNIDITKHDTEGADFGAGAKSCEADTTSIFDFAGTSISDGIAPYTGNYIGSDLFQDLNGKSATSAWTLKVKDTKKGKQGKIHCFGLSVTTDG